MAVLHDESSAPDLVRVEGLDSGHGSLKGAIRAYFEQGRRIIMEREEFIRIAMSRSLLQPELAVVIREKILDRQMKVLIDSLKTYLSEFRLSPAEIESFAMLLAGTNHTFNFLMRSVHQVEDAKIDAVFELLADSLIAKLEVRA